MPTLAQHLDGLMIRNSSVYCGLWVFPICLVSPGLEKGRDEFSTIEDGLKAETLHIHETGDMQKVRIENRGGTSVLALESETLLGGAQNRIINAGAVIGSFGSAELDSSCIEVQRWDCKSGKGIPEEKKEFRRSDFGFASLRRLKMAEAMHSLRRDRKVIVDQKKVWSHIVRQFLDSGASTKTLDLHDLYEFWTVPLKVYVQRFPAARGQVGLIVFLDRNTWFADIFLNVDLMLKQHRRLVRSSAFDCLLRIENRLEIPASLSPVLEDARFIFKKMKLATAHEFCSGGTTNMFFSSNGMNGLATMHGGSIIHLAACSDRDTAAPAAPSDIDPDSV